MRTVRLEELVVRKLSSSRDVRRIEVKRGELRDVEEALCRYDGWGG